MNLKVILFFLGLSFFSSPSYALQVQDSTSSNQFISKRKIRKANKRHFLIKNLTKKVQKKQNKVAKKSNRVRRWFRNTLLKLGVIILILLLATIIGLLMFYGNGTTQLIGRYGFGFLIGILTLGLIAAIADGDGIGKMSWLLGGVLTVIFAIACPEEFELIVEIIEILAEL